jgi:hypothetical protein
MIEAFIVMALFLREARRTLLSVFRWEHEPRALRLIERLALCPPEPSLADAVRTGRATSSGRCTHCDGPWSPDHPNEQHPRWVRQIRMPVPGPGVPRR